jgi:hypothetical protein
MTSPEMPSVSILRNSPVWREYYRARYGPFYDEALAILCRHDPMGWAVLSGNQTEYELELAGILSRLDEVSSLDEFTRMVHDEFIWWYGTEHTAGPFERYEGLALEIWNIWLNFKSGRRG